MYRTLYMGDSSKKYVIRLNHSGREWDFFVSMDSFTLGSHKSSNVVIANENFSPLHISFQKDEHGDWTALDENTQLGSIVNGSDLPKNQRDVVNFPLTLQTKNCKTVYKLSLQPVSETSHAPHKQVSEDSFIIQLQKQGMALENKIVSHKKRIKKLRELFQLRKMKGKNLKQRQATTEQEISGLKILADKRSAQVEAITDVIEERHKEFNIICSDIAKQKSELNSIINYTTNFMDTYLETSNSLQGTLAFQSKTEANIQTLKATQKSLLEEICAQDNASVKLEAKITAQDREKNKLSKEIEDLWGRREDQRKELSDLQSETSDNRKLLTELQGQFERLTLDKKISENEWNDLLHRSNLKSTELDELNDQIKQKNHSLEKSQASLLELEGKRKQISLNIFELEAEKVEYQSTNKQLKKQIQKATSNLELIQSNIDDETLILEKTQKEHKETLGNLSTTTTELNLKQENIVSQEQKSQELSKQLSSLQSKLAKKESGLEQVKQQLVSKSQELELFISTSKTKRISIENELKSKESVLESTNETIHNLNATIEAGQASVHANESALNAINSEIQTKELRTKECEIELNQAKKISENQIAESKEILEKLQSERATLQKEINMFNEEQSNYIKRFEQLRRKKETELQVFGDAEQAKLEIDFTEKAEKLELELAEHKRQVLLELRKEKIKWQQEKKERLDNSLEHFKMAASKIFDARVAPYANNNFTKQLRTYFIDDLLTSHREVLSAEIHGKAKPEFSLRNILSSGSQASYLTKKFWKTRGLQLSGGFAIFAFCLAYPSIPKKVYATVKQSVARKPASADAFVEKVKTARSNRAIYLPNQNTIYRETYSENILFLIGYEELKRDIEVQKDWNSKLNEFMIDELEMNDNIVENFISLEAPMIHSLMNSKENIIAKNDDSKIQQMMNFESMNITRLKVLLGGEKNYAKFRKFEKSFYESYMEDFKR